VLYPWLRAALPSPLSGLRLGGILGGDIPVSGAVEPGAGAAMLADYALGPVLLGVNGGYKRGFASGMNRLSANMNVTEALGPWTLYGEGAVNQPLGGHADAALRASVALAVTQQLSIDLNPAVLFTPAVVFNPNVGMSLTY
jgi:hypothetical protein